MESLLEKIGFIQHREREMDFELSPFKQKLDKHSSLKARNAPHSA